MKKIFHMTMKLTFELQVDAICRKADKHIYFFIGSFGCFMRLLWECFITFLLNLFSHYILSAGLSKWTRTFTVYSRIAGATFNDLPHLYVSTLKRPTTVALKGQMHFNLKKNPPANRKIMQKHAKHNRRTQYKHCNNLKKKINKT